MLVRDTAVLIFALTALGACQQDDVIESEPIPVKRAEKLVVENPIVEINPGVEVAEALNKAKAFAAQGREAQAQAQWRKVLRLDRNNPEALLGMAGSLFREGRIQESEQFYKRAIKASPKSLEARLPLAGMYRDQDRYTEALVESEAMIGFASYDENVLVLHGTLLLELGRQKEAIPFLEDALSKAPQRLDVRNNLANTYADTGQLPQAETLYREILGSNPTHADTHYNLGTVLQSQKRYKAALASYKDALSHAPDHAQAMGAAERLTIYLRRR